LRLAVATRIRKLSALRNRYIGKYGPAFGGAENLTQPLTIGKGLDDDFSHQYTHYWHRKQHGQT